MKVLAIINISNNDDLSCDSGVIFQRILINELIKRGIDYKVIGPDTKSFRELDSLEIKKYYIKLGTTRYASRFGFDWDAFQAIFHEEKPDIIFNNQVEITSAIRSLLVTNGVPHIPIVSYCHYPALWGIHNGIPQLDGSLNHKNLALPIVFNILSALTTANAFIVQSAFAKNLLVETASYFNIHDFPDILVIPPPYDPLLFEEPILQTPKDKRILYNHRLYQSYGIKEFLELIESMTDLDFELVVSDPMPHRSSIRNNLSSSPLYYRKKISQIEKMKLIDGNVPREKYKKIIKDTRIAFAAFRKACVWSMAAIDCMGLGIPVIAPNYASYPEFVPSHLLFDTLTQARELTRELLHDDSFWLESSKTCHHMVCKLAPHIISEKFATLFEEVLTNSSCALL